MFEKGLYTSYGELSVSCEPQNGTFCVRYGQETLLRQLRFVHEDGTQLALIRSEHDFDKKTNILRAVLGGADMEYTVEFRLDRYGMRLHMPGALRVLAQACWGEDRREDVYATYVGEAGTGLRCAIGPAASVRDNALYDRKTDRAFVIRGGREGKLRFDWQSNCYVLELAAEEAQAAFSLSMQKSVLAEEYGIPFRPMNRQATFSKPAAGWMTWYAVKFDASEETVLENLAFQEQYLKPYGADAFWIDWEWYHQNLKGLPEEGMDTFHPHPGKYPHGLKFISDKIKEAGFVPALWIGFTNDPAENDYAKAHPEIVLADDQTWCGRYFYDLTHPEYLNGFLTKALQNVLDWGYEAVKFDTLPMTMVRTEEYHHKLYDPSVTTRDAYRGMIQKVREILGENTYMLMCNTARDADYTYVADLFDAARVGGDIFKWSEFLESGVNRVIRFYPLHNVTMHADPDNVVLREEFNTYAQAATRAYFVSLLGLPMTFGDDFKVLPPERVALLQKCLPVMDVHPMEINESAEAQEELIVNLSVALPFASYNVVSVINFREEATKRQVSFGEDLYLEDGEYHVFDFEKESYLGAFRDGFPVENAACQTRVFCVRKKTGAVQLLSTSRHVTQGAAEIRSFEQTADRLCLSAELVGGDEYRVYLYVPEAVPVTADAAWKTERLGENLYRISRTPPESGVYALTVQIDR